QNNGSNAPAREVPPQAAQLTPPPIVASAPVAPPQMPVAMAPPPPQEAEKPKAQDATPRPRNEDYVHAPELQPLYLEFGQAALGAEPGDAVLNNGTLVKENPDPVGPIQGNADERGTAEYNPALGERRAKSAMDYLEANGIPKDRLSTISYGKER